MKTILHLALIILLLSTCKNTRNTNVGAALEHQPVDTATSILPPLESGELFCKNKNPYHPRFI